jgi:hypothetical protein
MTMTPRTLREHIDVIREGMVCERCGRYIGSLAPDSYLPPAYPVAVEDSSPEDEVRALVAFEWHLLGMMRQGKFVIRHPERDGVCVSIEEWGRDEEEDEEADGARGEAAELEEDGG